MNSEILKCPNCDNILFHNIENFKCVKNHTFDLAKEGYLNLLLPNQKKTKLPGDNKEMIVNREGFLSLGYYDKLADAIFDIFVNALKIKFRLKVLDLGCGSGYFLRLIPDRNIIKNGLDISKYAISKAAKLDKNSLYLVGSYKNIPFADKSIDVVVSNFAPLDLSEVVRVLKTNGLIIKVVPNENHMRQLAELIYHEFHPHTSDYTKRIESFKELKVISEKEIIYDCNITKTEALSLIGMTPYFHKFKLLDIRLPEFITVTFSFRIIEVMKN